MPLSTEDWQRLEILRIEDLSDVVLGAGLEVTQMTSTPVTGSLAFGMRDGMTFSTGRFAGRVALKGPLSEHHVTIGIGLDLTPGSRHWLEEVVTGNIGVFHAGDDHDALYTTGAFYAVVTLSVLQLEAAAAEHGLVLDRQMLGGTGIHERRVPAGPLERLRWGFERVHEEGDPSGRRRQLAIGQSLLDTVIEHYARAPRSGAVRPNPQGLARVVARARDYIAHHLEQPMSVDDVAAAACTSRRTLHRAFVGVLGETPYSYVHRLRLHRIRRDLARGDEAPGTIALVANRWGVGELGRLSGRYRALFGESPSETVARAQHGCGGSADPIARMARSA